LIAGINAALSLRGESPIVLGRGARTASAVASLGIAAAFLLAGCGMDADFKQARHLDESGEKMRALKTYERFLQRHPDDPRVEEASYRLGLIYSHALNRCPEAVKYFERAARFEGRRAADSRFELMNCPDYFPIRQDAKWNFVDSETGGNIMRLQIQVARSSGSASGEVMGWYFAGETRDRKYWRGYSKSEWTVWEQVEKGGRKAPILKYPFQKGRSWSVKRGENTDEYKVVGTGQTVKVRAGTFHDCVKVKVHTQGFPSWINQYFCPGVGRVKTTIGVSGAENPIEELAEYRQP